MKKAKILFIIWAIIVVIIIALLTIMGFIIKNRSEKYEELEAKLISSAKDYVFDNILLGENIIIKSSELIDTGYLEKLEVNGDICSGYVIITNDGTINYYAYIKCKHYKTLNYEENK